MSKDIFALKNTLVAIAVFSVLGYAAFNSRFIIQGPEITLVHFEEDQNSIISKDKTFFLEGTVEHSSFISVNGRPIFIDETGYFSEKLLLSNGVSIIDIYAKDKFGKEIRKKIDVLYQGESPLTDYASVAIAASASSTEIIHTEDIAMKTGKEVSTTTTSENESSEVMTLLSAATSTPSEQ